MQKFKQKVWNWFLQRYYKLQAQEQTNQKYSDSPHPNAFVSPFNHKAWQIIGDAFEYNESQHLSPQTSLFKEFIHRYSRSFFGVFGLVTLFLIVSLAIIVPFTTPDPTISNVMSKNLTFNEYDNNGIHHILGTDAVGRDLWARLWWGLRYSLALSLVVTTIEIMIGLAIGIMMGQFERFDRVMTFVIKVISVVPNIIILILLTIILSPSFWVIALTLSMTGWIGMANQIRAQVKRARNFEWVAASKVLGTPTYKILKNYVPVIIPILITQLVFTIPGVILSETSLAFIGLAIDDVPTLGNLISEGQKLFPTYLRYVFVPAFFLVTITTCVQFIGSSIQDALRRQK
ncbi:ABC transporter permease [Mycoplasma corogypsi]|uniref:ABC transporter permease n=1 Tax=Mycoplasma corogypsi TaxID=2106 RepID=UPI003873C1F0